MTWFTGTVVYLLTWWVVLFAVLPLWVTPAEPGERGHDAGAPKQALMWRKIAVTSVAAGIIWIGIYILVREPWFSFRGS